MAARGRGRDGVERERGQDLKSHPNKLWAIFSFHQHCVLVPCCLCLSLPLSLSLSPPLSLSLSLAVSVLVLCPAAIGNFIALLKNLSKYFECVEKLFALIKFLTVLAKI